MLIVGRYIMLSWGELARKNPKQPKKGGFAMYHPNGLMQRFVAVLIIVSPGFVSTALAQQSDSLSWSVTPYLWAPTTTIDLTFRDTDIGSGEISFNDLFDTLDTAFMIQVEAGKGSWSVFTDLS